ncbi:YbaN family protein [Oceanibaculum nanhaiense]|uniref:YbaN family protein n=1 Tax=Oceanibaculum nanhaiense TaxID=1909734 RepID=UPI000A36A1E3|nr:YbaN family protein [Oceanibaculum nanhaiense]
MSVQENTPSGPPSGPPTAAEPPGTHEAGLIGNRLLRVTLYALGCIFAALGLIGAFLPVVPTVPFLLVAVWCFSRSSPRFHHWLYTHPTFGPPIRNWFQHGIVPLKGKLYAVGGMAASWLMTVIFVFDDWLKPALMGGTMMLIGLYVCTRPSRVPVE